MRWLIRTLITIAIFIPFCIHHLSVNGYDFLNTLEQWAQDKRLVLTMPNTREEGIVIVDIDEKSIASLGQWPWSRDILARIVDELFENYDIHVLGFDVQFPERDRHDDLDLLDELEAKIKDPDIVEQLKLDEIRAQRDRDKMFADSIRGRNVVLGFTTSYTDDPDEIIEIGELPPPIIDLQNNPELGILPLIPTNGHIGNYTVLQSASNAGGNFNPLIIDDDGKIRSIAMLSQKGDKVYESLSMAVARKALGINTIGFGHEEFDPSAPLTRENVSSIILGDNVYPVGDKLEMLVPYRGLEGSFAYISAIDVLNNNVDKKILRDKVVLVGSRASGLRDLRVAPVSENFPGVEINANMVSGIILGNIMEKDESGKLMELALIIIIGLLATLLYPRFSVGFSVTFTLLVLVGLLLLNMIVWNENIVLPLVASVLFTILLFLAHMLFGYFVESRGKKQLSKLFGQYVPPELVNEMEQDLSHYSMDTQEAELTVMFADIRGFTPLSEALTPEQVTELLSEFLTIMTEVIHSKRGTIDKYMGDAIMAFWGAPLPNENHAHDALEAAFLMQEKMQQVNNNLTARGLPNISICIGLNTGKVRVGNMGSEFRMAYTAIGDAVNLAARLEALTRNYEVGILLGEATRKELDDSLCLELDIVKVKGKDTAVSIFEPLGNISSVSDEQAKMLEKYTQALQAYRNQDWSTAIRTFHELKSEYPERYLFQLYLERLEGFLETPPAPGWDGVFVYTSK
ncbi:MAG: adenylate/guanylate cyclase domain-containing protein [Gammaproteobacteria bacterium]|nr:adenylate/guanylate cyclase domain-containing protein [Gammaproteobacteria bacterium]